MNPVPKHKADLKEDSDNTIFRALMDVIYCMHARTSDKKRNYITLF